MTAEEALEDIRGYASANRVIITRHAYCRMEERGVTGEDVIFALSTAERCSSGNTERWNVDGRDIDGDEICLVVALEDGVVVITVFGARWR